MPPISDLPPKLWLPEKPAIIRPATPEIIKPVLGITMLARMSMVRTKQPSSGAPAVTPTTWDSSAKHASLTLSGGDLTATGSGTGSQTENVYSVAGRSTGKLYFEVLVTTVTGFMEIGIADKSSGTGSALDNSTACAIYVDDGTILSPDDSQSTSTFTSGDRLMFAINFTAAKAYFGKNGTWWADPTNASAGLAFNSSPTTYYAGLTMRTNTSEVGVVTANFGATAFTYTVPAGYSAGWGT